MLSNYTFLFYRDINPVTGNTQSVTPAILNSIITLTFPDSFQSLTNGSYVCSTGLTCNINSIVLTVTGYYATSATLSDTSVSFTVNGVMNPSFTGSSGEFLYTIKSPTGTLLDQNPSDPAIFPSAVTLTAATLTSCQISTTGVVYSQSSVTVTITPNNPIPVGGMVTITLPLNWTNSFLSDQLISSLVCTAITNVDNGISCSYQITTQTVVTVTGINPNTPLTTNFSFTMASMILPPTISPTDSITISTRLSRGDLIDTCTTTLTGVVQATLQNVTLAASNNTVSRYTTLQLSFINSVLLATVDIIKVTVPSSVGMPSLVNISTFTGFTNVTSGNIITIGNFSGSALSANNPITITLYSCVNPPTIKLTDSFTIVIQRTGRTVQAGSVTYQATAGTLTATLSSTSKNTNSITASQLFITLSSPLTIGSYLSMIYSYTPQTLSNNAKVTQCTVNSIIVSTGSYNMTNGILYFNGIFAAQGISNGNVSINFS
jgi:hypothetical protein